jgi:hypothetical protein
MCVYFFRQFLEVLPRVHTLLIGPGLGRHPLVMEVAAQASPVVAILSHTR